ncbi:MAG: FAD-dependent oxidoreductase [Xanthomonadaceae bacterium]|nr:FAD-dependent oxidoreductase [Xanthomonadaceae bacterium]
MNRRQSDVLILGGGAVGLACALYLLRAGRSVTVIERGRAGGATSHGNCGTITPSHAVPLAAPGVLADGLRWMLKKDAPLRIAPRADFALFEWLLQFARRCNARECRRVTSIKTPLLLRARSELEELVRGENLDCEFHAAGTMNVYRDARAFEKSQASVQSAAEFGIAVETLDGAACRLREPALNDSIVGGHFHPGDAQLRPERYCAELVRAIVASGGEIRESTTISGFRTAGDRVESVVTHCGEFTGREIVFALGAWSPQLARQLDLRIPIQPGKGYSITYTRPARYPRIPLSLKERAVCVTAWDSGYRLGSTMEFSGYDDSLNRTRLDALKRGAAEYLIEPEGPCVVEEWYGWRPMTYDDLPILGRTASLKNLVLATGHGMLGITMSAITGRLIAELVNGASPSLDLAPFSPARFNI